MEQERTEIVVPPEGGGERLDVYLVREFPEMTRATAQRLVSEGHVLVNGLPQKSSLKLRGGETIIVEIPPPREVLPEPESIDLNIVYEDAHLVVLNKEAGMVVHQGAGNFTGTLVNALLAHCGDLSGIGGELRPGIVHRIDKDTTGLLVVAKSDRAHQGLSHQFKEHTIKRLYQALVYGSPKEDSGKIDSAIGRHPVDRKKMAGGVKHGKHAVTRWHVLARYEGVSHMKLRLETGRTHQIRVHLSEAGHPLVGDPVYSSGRIGNIRDPKLKSLITKLDRQALHAKTLGFVHPVTQEYLEFDSELPADMQAIIDYLSGDEPTAL